LLSILAQITGFADKISNFDPFNDLILRRRKSAKGYLTETAAISLAISRMRELPQSRCDEDRNGS
jgi:hypothetical protein